MICWAMEYGLISIGNFSLTDCYIPEELLCFGTLE